MAEQGKRPVGRPSKYDEDIQMIADDYCENYGDYGDVVPTVVGLALAMDVATNTVYNWANENNPDFLRIFTRIEQLQHQGLVNGGLSNTFNPAITKMMLTKHGYSDKQELAHTSPDGSMSPAENQEAVLAALARKHKE